MLPHSRPDSADSRQTENNGWTCEAHAYVLISVFYWLVAEGAIIKVVSSLSLPSSLELHTCFLISHLTLQNFTNSVSSERLEHMPESTTAADSTERCGGLF